MTRVILCFTFLALGCASSAPQRKPFRVSMLPPSVEVEKLVPPKVEIPIDTSNVERFEDTPINGGEYCEGAGQAKECQKLLPGILIDEAHYVEGIADKSARKRLETENRIFRQLRKTERDAVAKAETAYQDRISELETENIALQQPHLWDQIKFPVGLAFGAGFTVLTAFAVAEAVR